MRYDQNFIKSVAPIVSILPEIDAFEEYTIKLQNCASARGDLRTIHGPKLFGQLPFSLDLNLVAFTSSEISSSDIGSSVSLFPFDRL
jgi:hypothetical protein